jgi:hypothetical protein
VLVSSQVAHLFTIKKAILASHRCGEIARNEDAFDLGFRTDWKVNTQFGLVYISRGNIEGST